ncbi:MAG TPA: dihydroorotate dehydrogenase-like protein [Rhodospirillaceae bacterium]|nr:MAG: hypothetical protein A2018_04730 [Alphaproteobacteria bacterium GWF2_58_20]HAU28823.1 dihydroorotate dehydrogenase-like protein [Rhodospirillaceae bacterium]
MKTSVTYLGLPLSSPLIAGASPLGQELDTLKRLEDSGAAAVVLPSLFEEEIKQRQRETITSLDEAPAFEESQSFFTEPPMLSYGPDAYLEHVRKVKEALGIPVIASLNGTSNDSWVNYARQIEEAGADALELNLNIFAANPHETSTSIEQRLISIIRHIRSGCGLPLAVKISPQFTALANLASQMEAVGARGLVMFNRFFQPEIDIENLSIQRKLKLSTSAELPPRLAWLSVMSGTGTGLSLSVSGGVHTGEDVIRSIMSGADTVQLVSALIKKGPEYIGFLKAGLTRWMEEHEYASIDAMRGSMNLARCPDPSAYLRVNYMNMLHSWKYDPSAQDAEA